MYMIDVIVHMYHLLSTYSLISYKIFVPRYVVERISFFFEHVKKISKYC
jgi:hypothetical protein